MRQISTETPKLQPPKFIYLATSLIQGAVCNFYITPSSNTLV